MCSAIDLPGDSGVYGMPLIQLESLKNPGFGRIGQAFRRMISGVLNTTDIGNKVDGEKIKSPLIDNRSGIE